MQQGGARAGRGARSGGGLPGRRRRRREAVDVRVNINLNWELKDAQNSPELLVDILEDNEDVLNGVNVVTALQALLRTQRHWRSSPASRIRAEAGLELLVDRMVEIADEAGPRELSSAAWAITNIKQATPSSAPSSSALYTAVAAEAEARAHEWNSQDISNTLWALASAGGPSSAYGAAFEALAPRVAELADEFAPPGISSTLWAFAASGHRAPEVFEALSEPAAKLARQLKPGELANTVWAFAAAGAQAPPELLSAGAHKAARQAQGMDPSALARVAWGYAKLAFDAPEVFEAVAVEINVRDKRRFSSGELANIAWAYATAGHPAPKVFDAVASQVVGRAEEFDAAALADTIWAFAKSRHRAPKVFKAAAGQASKQARNWSPRNLTAVSWAFATVGQPSPELFKAVAAQAVPRINAFSPALLARLAWSYATINHSAAELLDAIAQAAVSLFQASGNASPGAPAAPLAPRDLARLLWAFAVLQHPAPLLFEAARGPVLVHAEAKAFRPDELVNTVWAYAAADGGMQMSEDFCRRVSLVLADLPDPSGANPLLMHAEAAMDSRVPGSAPHLPPAGSGEAVGEQLPAAACLKPSPAPAHIIQGIIEALQSLKLPLECSEGFRGGLFEIELALVAAAAAGDGQKRGVALEVEGPASHTRTQPYQLLGYAALHHRLLEADGWDVVCIPFHEWANQMGDADMQRAYLSKKLAEARVVAGDAAQNPAADPSPSDAS